MTSQCDDYPCSRRCAVSGCRQAVIGDASPDNPNLSAHAMVQLERCWHTVLHNVGLLTREQRRMLRVELTWGPPIDSVEKIEPGEIDIMQNFPSSGVLTFPDGSTQAVTAADWAIGGCFGEPADAVPAPKPPGQPMPASDRPSPSPKPASEALANAMRRG